MWIRATRAISRKLLSALSKQFGHGSLGRRWGLLSNYFDYCSDCDQTSCSGKDRRLLFVGCPKTCPANPRWRAAAILEKSINRDMFVTVWPIWTKFGIMTRTWPLDTMGRQNVHCAKKRRWRSTITGSSLYLRYGWSVSTTGIGSRESARRRLPHENYLRFS